MASIIHRIPMGFMHIGGTPILFSFPGVQTHSLVPLTRTVRVPSAAISATVASLVTCSGPARRALVILGSSPLSVPYWPPETRSLDTISFRPISSTVERPDRASACPELLVSKAAAAIVVARNSLRVFIDAPFFSQRSSRGSARRPTIPVEFCCEPGYPSHARGYQDRPIPMSYREPPTIGGVERSTRGARNPRQASVGTRRRVHFLPEPC